MAKLTAGPGRPRNLSSSLENEQGMIEKRRRHDHPFLARFARGAPRSVLRRAAGVFVLSVFAACGGRAQQPASDQVVSSDPELQRLAEEILPGLVARTGLELSAPVRIERRSRSELVGYLRAKLDEELPPEEAEATVRVYALLGLVEPDLDLRALLLELYTEQVAGFYEPDSTALFVMDDQPPDQLESLLLHELVHAVQDQSADLEAITSSELGNDRAAAAHAAIEGHATLVMLEFMMERMTDGPVDLAAVPGLASRLMPGLDGMAAQFPALAGAPEVVQRSLLFPYVQGAAFVQGLWATEGRVAPFGAWLPTSTEQVLEGSLADPPVPVDLTVVGGRAVHSDVLGSLELEVLLETHLGAERVDLAAGWGGDRYVLTLPDRGGPSVLTWASVWDDVESRDRFVSALGAELDRIGPDVVLTPISVDGHPGALLTIGDFEGLSVEVRAGAAG